MPSSMSPGGGGLGGPAGEPEGGSPHRLLLDAFDEGVARQEGLCRDLEGLADLLPARLDTLRALWLLRRLRADLEDAHWFEQEAVFPALLLARADLGPVLDRLRAEHAEDEDAAADLEEALAAFAAGRDRRDAERLGYMLRGLFTALRRHVAQDREFVRPLLCAPP